MFWHYKVKVKRVIFNFCDRNKKELRGLSEVWLYLAVQVHTHQNHLIDNLLLTIGTLARKEKGGREKEMYTRNVLFYFLK